MLAADAYYTNYWLGNKYFNLLIIILNFSHGFYDKLLATYLISKNFILKKFSVYKNTFNPENNNSFEKL
jgi:hypothetical protein